MVKGYRINLRPYPARYPRLNSQTKEVELVEATLHPVDVLINEFLFHPVLQLTGRRLLEHGALADKLEASSKQSIVVDKKDHDILKECVEKVQVQSRASVELARRILDAPEVELKEVTPPDNGREVEEVLEHATEK